LKTNALRERPSGPRFVGRETVRDGKSGGDGETAKDGKSGGDGDTVREGKSEGRRGRVGAVDHFKNSMRREGEIIGKMGRKNLGAEKTASWRVGGLAGWRVGRLASWRIGGLAAQQVSESAGRRPAHWKTQNAVFWKSAPVAQLDRGRRGDPPEH
jgi:hypothetical protein